MISDKLKTAVRYRKLKHETHLDFEMREYYAARVKGYIKPSESKEYIADNKKATLDSQGRHRSEWCYSPYDGREESPTEKIRETWDILLDRYNNRSRS
jgi:hypothetical protein